MAVSGGSRRFPVGSRTVRKFRRRRTRCRGTMHTYMCTYTYPKTRQIYIFSTYAPRESLFFLNITLTFSSQFVNFGLFGDNRRKGFCPCFINIFSISCIFLHLRPLRNIRKIRNPPEPPDPSGTLRNFRNIRPPPFISRPLPCGRRRRHHKACGATGQARGRTRGGRAG